MAKTKKDDLPVSDHVCDNKTLSQTVAYQHKTIEKLQERIAELEQENRRLREYMAYIADGCEFPRHLARYALQEERDEV